jgi:nucleotide-binding universal stress UspA family protein
MFVRGRRWSDKPRIGAAIDASSAGGIPLAREIAALAFQIQRHTHGIMEVVSCMPAGAPGVRSEVHSRRLHEALAEVPLLKDGVHMLEGDPDTTVPRFSAERHYDVLVMGALAHRAGLAPVVGSLTSRLIEALDCDFFLVKAPGALSRSARSLPNERAYRGYSK